MVLRVDHIALLGFLIDPTVLDAVFVLNLGILLYRLVAIVDAYRVADLPQWRRSLGRGLGGTGAVRTEPAVDRRPVRDHPGHGRQPHRRGALRHARERRPRQRLHLRRRRLEGMRPRHLAEPRQRVCSDRLAERRRQRRLRFDRLPCPGEHPGRHRRPQRLDPAVGRQGASQHPAHRRRPAARRQRRSTPTR